MTKFQPGPGPRYAGNLSRQPRLPSLSPCTGSRLPGFIRNNLHDGVVSGAARGQALRGPMWAGLTPDSKGDPTGDTGGLIAADRRHHTCLRDAREHCRPLQAARQVPGKKN